MILFIRDEQFSVKEFTDESGRIIRHVEIRLPFAITEPTATAPPSEPELLEFVLDTGSDYASVFKKDLVDSSVDPDKGPSGGLVDLILMDGHTADSLPTRDVSLWLYSNIPELRDQPFRIDPSGGVVVLPDIDQDLTTLTRSLLGMNPLLNAGLKIEINTQLQQFSVWLPD